MRVHVIDFEGSLKCGVVEYGVVTLDGAHIVETLTGLCRPDAPMHPKDVLVHGLRDDMLRDQPSFEEFRDLFYQLRHDGTFAAHHAPVENAFLGRYWHTVPIRHALQHPCPSRGSWGPWIDSRVVYQRHYSLGEYSLQSLIRGFQLEHALESLGSEYCPSQRCKPHCALYDALASALLLQTTIERLGIGFDEWMRASQPLTVGDAAQSELL